MKNFWAIALLSVVATFFWAASAIWPDLASKEFLRSLCGLFAVAWAILILAMPKLSELISLEGLSDSEREKLLDNVTIARKKIWRIGFMSLLCVVALLLLTVVANPSNVQLVAAFAGLTAGVGIYFLTRAKSWHDEIHNFTARANAKRLANKSREENLKQFN